ncbi:hypothetical protein ACTA71_002628 [Dictyostelium dimigraforme]
MDYKSNYSESTLEYVEIQECILEKQKLLQLQKQLQQIDYFKPQTNQFQQQQQQQQQIQIQQNFKNKDDEEILKSEKLEEVITISPYLTIGMKYGLIIEFLMVIISMLQYIIVGKWLEEEEEDRVENYWPINKYYGLFLFTIVFNGMVSAWKGYKIDKRLFFAGHHLLTMLFFFICFVYFPTVKYYFYLVIYLVMRLGKRLKDEGYMDKDQWITFYVSYAYVQTLVIVTIQCLQPNQSGLLDIIGGIAHIDSLITCRKENFSGKRLNGNSKWLIPICIIPFLLIEFLIKPSFSSFKRPYCYKFSNHSSFPSCHTAITSIVISSIDSISPLQRGGLLMLMATYRVYTRAHTVEDICAGFAIGQVLSSSINCIGFYFGYC